MGGQATERLVGGRYSLIESIGRGGMGVVWRARDTLLERDVAVKEIHFPPGTTEEERRILRIRVFREARAAARLSHPSVVTVYDVIEEEDRPFIVMELVDAPSLAEVVRERGPLAPAAAARVGLDILSALGVAHAAGVIHRDIKPGNVMVRAAGHSELADFGIASVKDDPSVTSTGLVLGSPAYMAPEQASQGVTSPASDLWSLGATLYYAVEGRPPFEGDGALPTLTAVIHAEPQPMRTAGSMSPLLKQLLDKDASRRPGHAEVRRQLERIASGTAGAEETLAATTAATRIDPYPSERRRAEGTTQLAGPRLPPAAALDHTVVHPPAGNGAASGNAAMPPARQYDGRGGRSSRPVVLVLVISVLALAFGAIGIKTLTSGDDAGRPAATPADPSPQSPRASSKATVPADWVTFRHPATGYTIRHPPQWTVQRDGARTDIKDPNSDAYLRVEYTDDPGDDPDGRWREVESVFRQRVRNYRRIRIVPSEFKGYDAGIWEFTYDTSGGTTVHSLDLGFVTGEYGFALFYQTRRNVWSGAQAPFDAFKASFQAPT